MSNHCTPGQKQTRKFQTRIAETCQAWQAGRCTRDLRLIRDTDSWELWSLDGSIHGGGCGDDSWQRQRAAMARQYHRSSVPSLPCFHPWPPRTLIQDAYETHPVGRLLEHNQERNITSRRRTSPSPKATALKALSWISALIRRWVFRPIGGAHQRHWAQRTAVATYSVCHKMIYFIIIVDRIILLAWYSKQH
jgi:hypothetical protein